MTIQDPCPCGSELEYEDCCGKYHNGAVAPTVEALMRSRYSAFALDDADYLFQTWHPKMRRHDFELDDNPEWVQLQIISAQEQDDHGTVHFRAFYREGRAIDMLEEESEFERIDGRWYYVDGKIR
ncbi:YchJ family protein [Pseudidiomarina aestuarii]|uniref:YchJ family protein n=1 Tax=Pseudidiomarina aestuarii TaxID=624146 RepID=UPI003A97B5DF